MVVRIRQPNQLSAVHRHTQRQSPFSRGICRPRLLCRCPIICFEVANVHDVPGLLLPPTAPPALSSSLFRSISFSLQSSPQPSPYPPTPHSLHATSRRPPAVPPFPSSSTYRTLPLPLPTPPSIRLTSPPTAPKRDNMFPHPTASNHSYSAQISSAPPSPPGFPSAT